jgi:26S proteasome regulatory subunit N8
VNYEQILTTDCSNSYFSSQAREKIVGWYHTGPKLHQNDVAINELIRQYCPNSILVIIDAEPRDMGLPTEAYHAVEEVHDVNIQLFTSVLIEM